MVGAWHGRGVASVNQTRPHCVNEMGKTPSKPLAARHGRGTAWVRHGNGRLCVNQPLTLRAFVEYEQRVRVPSKGEENPLLNTRYVIRVNCNLLNE